MRVHRIIFYSLLIVFTAQIRRASASQKDIDWSKIDSREIVLFYPGVSSWEFLNSEDHRLGGREIRKAGKECRKCHLGRTGELDMKADEIAAGTLKMKRSQRPFEPSPVPAKKGTMRLAIKSAYDGEFFYIMASWESKGRGFGKGPAPDIASDRISFQINRDEAYFKKYGCFIACHDDLNAMPETPSKKAVSTNPYFSALGRDDVRLYAFYAKDAWDKPRQADISKKKATGGLIDLVSVEIEGRAFKAQDGWVLEDRRWEEGGDAGVSATGGFSGGRYTVVLKRSLKAQAGLDQGVEEGQAIAFAAAVHEDNADKRRHYVSFPFTIGFGADGDIRAKRIDIQ
ncbi:MAG: ethylbenzene dehydrogenase-related protein [Deltaproteobacteria bacterium]